MSRYGKFRSSRFLIDKIDAKLGSVDKEIEFDKTMIYGSLAVIALEIILLALTSVSDFFNVPAIVGAFLAALCIFIIPIMIQELKDDLKKAEKKNAKDSETDKASTEK